MTGIPASPSYPSFLALCNSMLASYGPRVLRDNRLWKEDQGQQIILSMQLWRISTHAGTRLSNGVAVLGTPTFLLGTPLTVSKNTITFIGSASSALVDSCFGLLTVLHLDACDSPRKADPASAHCTLPYRASLYSCSGGWVGCTFGFTLLLQAASLCLYFYAPTLSFL